MVRCIPRLASLGLPAAALALAASGALAASPARPGHASYVSWNAKTHTATLKITAGLTGANNGLNFNGYANGHMVITVPKGARVKVTFANKGSFPHSAVIAPYADRMSGSSASPAFKGASSPDPAAGTSPGTTVHFSFVAGKVGKYALVCAVDGHADHGMWDVFRVTSNGKPAVTFHGSS